MKTRELQLPLTQIDDSDADYWLTKRHEFNLGDAVKRSEMHLTESERRGRYLAVMRAHADTDIHPVVVAPPITGWRKLLIKWRLRRQYWTECAAAGVAS